MKGFVNMKIRAKLITGFVLVALIAGIVGTVAIVNFQSIDKRYGSLYVDYGAANADIGQASTAFQRIRLNLRDVMLSDGSDADSYTSKIDGYEKEMQDALNRFETTLKTDEERTLYASLTSKLAEYKSYQDRMLKLAASNERQQAIDLMRGDAYASSAAAADQIQQLFDRKVAKGNEISERLSAQTRTIMAVMIGIIAIAMVVAVALGLVIARMISRPVKHLVDAAGQLAAGDLNIEIEARTTDEIGTLGTAFRRMADNLNEVMTNITSAAEQVNAGAKQVSETSIALSQGAMEQASSVEQLTASMEEIAAQTTQNAGSAGKANALAEAAQHQARQGNERMKEMLQAMDEINASSASISKIIKAIDEIAFQTNILALNAAVEAARAGQHGKGFAVVAEEVRNLAARSANAAKETTAMIEGSIRKVEDGTKIAKETAAALERIVAGVAEATAIVGEIAAASDEQAVGIAQVNQGIMQVSAVVQTNSATSEESAAASEELSTQADLLREQIARFKLKPNGQHAAHGGRGAWGSADWTRQFEARGSAPHTPDGRSSKLQISLSDQEFGKYG